MGSILDDQDEVDIQVSITDPTDTAGTTKVEVIVNGGQTLAEQTFEGGSAELSFDNLPPPTATITCGLPRRIKTSPSPLRSGWASMNAGVSKTASDVALPIKGDEINISSQIYNNLSEDMTVTSPDLYHGGPGGAFPHRRRQPNRRRRGGGARTSDTYAFPYTVTQAGGFNINVQMKATIGGGGIYLHRRAQAQCFRSGYCHQGAHRRHPL